ncbi:MAG TPA: FAD-dependent oxidoreductase [Planctomycetota bacterium]|nr:FAD-dependent oxidoreductase [Planctomycetota bacterium]
MTTHSSRNTNYDTIIIGGGTAGVVAAIQAGRAGAKALLVEKSGMLGGTVTVGGVNYPGLFFAWKKQVVAGIGWELVQRCLQETGQRVPEPVHDFEKTHGSYHIPVDRFIFAALCDEAVEAAGVEMLFHTMIAGLAPGAGGGWEVTLCTKTGLTTRTASVIIDATGDANATALAGFPLSIPDENQPATLCCHAGGYDTSALDIDAINRAFDAEVRAGRLHYTDASWNTKGPDVGRWLIKAGENATHTHHINARDSEGKTQLEIEARKGLLRFYRFLRRQPKLEKLCIVHMAPECGVRETATIQGKRTVTVDDYVSGRVWDDAVCYSFYMIDLHVSSGNGIEGRGLAEGVVPTIPRGAMLPAGSRNFIVAGRCISSDRLANSALRVQASCMAIGQAAGALAALAVQHQIDPEEVAIDELHHLLRRHQAITPKL